MRKVQPEVAVCSQRVKSENQLFVMSQGAVTSPWLAAMHPPVEQHWIFKLHLTFFVLLTVLLLVCVVLEHQGVLFQSCQFVSICKKKGKRIKSIDIISLFKSGGAEMDLMSIILKPFMSVVK